MDTLLELCKAVLLLTGGFLVMSLWLAAIIFVVVETNDNRKERIQKKEGEEDVR